MFNKDYSNFVRAGTEEECKNAVPNSVRLSGEQAKRLYIEEVKDISDPTPAGFSQYSTENEIKITKKPSIDCVNTSNNELFLAVQNNEVNTLRSVLNHYPEKIRLVDDFGWSLLMIACQANAVDTVIELLKRNIDTTIRDKAGNSATSLVIMNKNLTLADILIKHKAKETPKREKHKKIITKQNADYLCEICKSTFSDHKKHFSSTLHNINACKGKKIPAKYVIPASNKGYQLMVKVGWDRESGLGPDGSGNMYPIKAKQKKDRKGLGHDKKMSKEEECKKDKSDSKRKKANYSENRKLEINFRREFY